MSTTDRPGREQVDTPHRAAALLLAAARVDPTLRVAAEVVQDALIGLDADVRALRSERDAALALATEWEQEANARQPHTLMAYEIHEMNGEQSTCRTHARQLREALGPTGGGA